MNKRRMDGSGMPRMSRQWRWDWPLWVLWVAVGVAASGAIGPLWYWLYTRGALNGHDLEVLAAFGAVVALGQWLAPPSRLPVPPPVPIPWVAGGPISRCAPWAAS